MKLNLLKLNFQILIIFMLSLPGLVNAQQAMVKIITEGSAKEIQAIEKQGVSYVSARQLANALGAGIYYNPQNSKLELKFTNYLLKLTGSNQFVVITPRKGSGIESFQMPVSAIKLRNDILIPLNYAIKAFSRAKEEKIQIEKTSAPAVESEDKTGLPEKEDIPELAAGEFGTRGISPTAKAEIKKEAPAKERTVKTEVKVPKAKAYDITSITADVKTNGTLVNIHSKKKISKYNTTISDGVLYLNMVGITADEGLGGSFKGRGLVKKAIVKRIGANTQIEFHLKDGYSSAETIYDARNNSLLISIRNKTVAHQASESGKERWKLDAVVIDAGHGGKDPGAIGVTGEKEKDINLAIALKLGSLIESRMNDVKVIYTRSTDKFVELYKRGKIANENNGKMFISIHCNSMPKKPNPRSGFEIYLLRPGRTSEAVSIAERENSVIKYEDNPSLYRELTEDNFILVSMAHSSYMRYSEQFSDILDRKFRDNLTLGSNGIKQAGFYVLVGASMPSVLVEAGFLSNHKDEAYLSSKSGQSAIASSIFSAIRSFKDEYDRELRAAK